MRAADAIKLLSGVDHLYVSKGKKTVHFNLKTDRPDDETLLRHMLGPTGNLRAPTVRKGAIVLVGFDADVFKEVFGLA